MPQKSQHKILLDESQLPQAWYNINADLLQSSHPAARSASMWHNKATEPAAGTTSEGLPGGSLTAKQLRCKFDGMTRTQIQLPDELYQRAKRFAAEREMSLAEMTRRGLELLLDRYPSAGIGREPWSLPRVNGGGLKVSLAALSDIATHDEEARSLGQEQ